jgi:hypothetical protein
MAVLTAAQRKHHTGGASKFALPGGKFPIGDTSHAVAAKRLVGRSLAKGNITPAQAATVRHKASQVLGETDSTYHNGK